MKNWYKLYYQDSKTTQKLKPNSKLIFELNDDITIYTKNYKDALYYNAGAVAESISGPMNVLLSGGVDSEMIVRINKELGIKQNVCTFKFENDLNVRDVESAIEICKSLNVPLKIIDFNVKKFFENDAETYYNRIFYGRVEALPRLKWFEFFDGPLIFGEGEPYVGRVFAGDYSKKSTWRVVFFEHEFIYYLYSSFIDKNCFCPWYHFTPEVHGNFLNIELIKNLIDDKIFGKQSSYSSKALINKEVFKDISIRPKLVGYEGKDMPPGSIPDFMKDFRDSIMKDATDCEFYFNSEDWQGYFK